MTESKKRVNLTRRLTVDLLNTFNGINNHYYAAKAATAVAASSNSIGAHGYTLLRKKPLGEGSSAEVHLAKRLKDGGLVAMKIARDDTKEFEPSTLMDAEKNALETLRHSTHVVPLLDHFAIQGKRHLVFPYMQGGSLRQRIQARSGRPFVVEDIRSIVVQVAHALRDMKKHNLVHGDLKPDNIMMIDPKELHLCVIDFGMCNSADKAFDYLQTSWYRAPEVMLNVRRLYSGALDMWSLGCIVLEMATCLPAFARRSSRAQIVNHVRQLGMYPAKLLEESELSGQLFNRDCNGKWFPTFGLVTPPTFRMPVFQTRGADGKIGRAPKEYQKAMAHLVERMLDPDPETRMTPNEALAICNVHDDDDGGQEATKMVVEADG